MMISSKGSILGRQTRRHLKAFYPLKDKFGTDCRLQTKRQYVHATSTQYMSHVITSLPLLGDSKLSSRIFENKNMFSGFWHLELPVFK